MTLKQQLNSGNDEKEMEKLNHLSGFGRVVLFPEKLNHLSGFGRVVLFPEKLNHLSVFGRVVLFPEKRLLCVWISFFFF